jgi:hypothetical protein
MLTHMGNAWWIASRLVIWDDAEKALEMEGGLDFSYVQGMFLIPPQTRVSCVPILLTSTGS